MGPKHYLWQTLVALLLALILGRFIIVGLPKILFNHQSSDGDESAYLSLGLDLLEEGRLSDGTRPPLYSLLLTPLAGREWSYFTGAKLLTLGLGVLTILATFWAGGRMFGWPTALLAAFLLGANKEFHIRSATVYADVLLALVMIGGWYFLIKSVEGWPKSLWAGIFVGLAFLTKGSAPVLLAAWGGMALLHYRLAIFRQFHLLLVPLLFVIVSLPLLIYNANTFGSPTYNFATQHIMWMDRLEQINTADPDDLPSAASYLASHSPAEMVERVQKGLRRLNPVISRSVIPNRSFEPAWLGLALAILAGATLLYLLAYRRQTIWAYLIRRKNAYLFTLFLYGLFYPFFTWYVAGSSAETRFVVPLLAPFYLLLADVIVTLGRGLGQRLAGYQLSVISEQLSVISEQSSVGSEQSSVISEQSSVISEQLSVGGDQSSVGSEQSPNSRQSVQPSNLPTLRLRSGQVFHPSNLPITIYRLFLALMLAWACWWLLSSAWADRWALTINPYESDRQANLEEEAIVQWLSRDRATEALVLFGPSKSLPLWKFPRRFSLERLPVDIDTWNAMERYLQERQPDYIILDEDTVRRRRQALGDYFQYDEAAGLIDFQQQPPNWALALIYPALPCRWCIFSPTPKTQPIATFENGLELLDFRLAHTPTAKLAQNQTSPNLARISHVFFASFNSQSLREISHLPISPSPHLQSPHLPISNLQLLITNYPLPAPQSSSLPVFQSSTLPPFHPSTPLRLILTWRATAPLPADYTFFVHLTAPDGFVKAQHDRQPFDGLRPTGQWRPGELYADRYDIPLDESVTPGDYLLLAGLYDPVTGERLALLDGPTGPAPETLLLGRIEIEE